MSPAPGTACPLQFPAVDQSFGPALAVPVEKALIPPEPLPVSVIAAVNGTPAVSAVPIIDPAEPDQVIVEKNGCVDAFSAVRSAAAVVATFVFPTVEMTKIQSADFVDNPAATSSLFSEPNNNQTTDTMNTPELVELTTAASDELERRKAAEEAAEGKDKSKTTAAKKKPKKKKMPKKKRKR